MRADIELYGRKIRCEVKLLDKGNSDYIAIKQRFPAIRLDKTNFVIYENGMPTVVVESEPMIFVDRLHVASKEKLTRYKNIQAAVEMMMAMAAKTDGTVCGFIPQKESMFEMMDKVKAVKVSRRNKTLFCSKEFSHGVN